MIPLIRMFHQGGVTMYYIATLLPVGALFALLFLGGGNRVFFRVALSTLVTLVLIGTAGTMIGRANLNHALGGAGGSLDADQMAELRRMGNEETARPVEFALVAALLLAVPLGVGLSRHRDREEGSPKRQLTPASPPVAGEAELGPLRDQFEGRNTIFSSKITLRVYERGLFVRRGNDVFVGTWDTVDALTYRVAVLTVNGFIPAGTQAYLSLWLPGGLRIELAGKGRAVRNVAETLYGLCTPALVERSLKAHARGDSFDFGVLELDVGGLRHAAGGTPLPIAEIGAFTVDNGVFLLDTMGGRNFCRVPTVRIKNFAALLAILRSGQLQAGQT